MTSFYHDYSKEEFSMTNLWNLLNLPYIALQGQARSKWNEPGSWKKRKNGVVLKELDQDAEEDQEHTLEWRNRSEYCELSLMDRVEDFLLLFSQHSDGNSAKPWRMVGVFLCVIGNLLYYFLPTSVTPLNLTIMTLLIFWMTPSFLANNIVYPLYRLLFGTLYPAYASYKAVRTKNVKEYVKWMMYWIVFALFTCAETFTDVFFSWFPFYYEVKILMVVWLLSPATKGSSILYRKFVHPALCRREQEIDEYISKAKDQGYHTVLNLGTKGVNYATNVIMQTAIRGGGGLVQQLRKSYSLSDLSISDDRSDRSQQEMDEVDDIVADHRVVRRSTQGRTPREVRGPRTMSAPRMDMIFAEVDVDRHSSRSSSSRESVNLSHIRSSEDISGPYPTEKSNSQDALTRTASVGGASARTRSKVIRSTFTSIKRPGAAEDEEPLIEELEDESLPDAIQTSLLSDGIVCMPNSNDVFMQYLRHLVEKDLLEKSVDKGNKSNDDEYEKYARLRDKYETQPKITDVGNDIDNSEKIKDINLDKNMVDLKKSKDNESTVQPSSQTISLEGKDTVFAPKTDHNHTTPTEVKLETVSAPKTDETISKEVKEEITLLPKIDQTHPITEVKVGPVLPSKVDVVVSSDEKIKLDGSSTQLDQLLKIKDSLVPEVSIVWNEKSSDEIASIGASSSTLSSDDELSEFATPNSSPKLKAKVKKYKKRQAPPPPQAIKPIDNLPADVNLDEGNNPKKDMDSQNLIDPENVVDDKITVSLKIPPVEDIKTTLKDDKSIAAKLDAQVIEGVKVSETEHAKKHGSKGSAFSKLMHLPAKLSFWNSGDESKKSTKAVSKESLNVIASDVNIRKSNDSINIGDPKEVERVASSKVNLESDEDSFQDAVDSDVKVDNKNVDSHANADNKNDDAKVDNKNIANDNNDKTSTNNDLESRNQITENSIDYIYVPLTISTLSINTESRSTDV